MQSPDGSDRSGDVSDRSAESPPTRDRDPDRSDGGGGSARRSAPLRTGGVSPLFDCAPAMGYNWNLGPNPMIGHSSSPVDSNLPWHRRRPNPHPHGRAPAPSGRRRS